MGESKRRAAYSSTKRFETVDKLKKIFDDIGVDCSSPGFYDDKLFLLHEKRNPLFIERYAEWVLNRERTIEYDENVKEIIEKLAPIIEARIVRHNWIGACIAITGALTRIIDKLGVWNVPVIGSASAYTLGESRHFAIIDDNEGVGFEPGHMWIIAPPYDVIDMTLHYQRWMGDSFRQHIPRRILAIGAPIVPPRAQDVVAPNVLMRNEFDPKIHFRIFPDQKRIISKFPARRFVSGALDIRYVPGGIRFPKEPLDEINSKSLSGVPAIQIWREDVAPAFGVDS